LQSSADWGCKMDAIEEQYRRMVFNLIARNQDDHDKNIAFLLDRSGTWSLAPAGDVVDAYNPSGTWTSTHQISLAGKRDNFTLADVRMVAETASMKRGRAEAICRDVTRAVFRWREFAVVAQVLPKHVDMIAGTHRLDPVWT